MSVPGLAGQQPARVTGPSMAPIPESPAWWAGALLTGGDGG